VTIPSAPLFILAIALAALPVSFLGNWLADRLSTGAGIGDAAGPAPPDGGPKSAPPGDEIAWEALDLSRFPAVARYRPAVTTTVLVICFGALARGVGVDWRLVPGLFYVTLFLVIAVVDLEHRIIPNELVVAGSLAALGFSMVPAHPVPLFFAAVGGAAGLIIFGVVYLLGYALSRLAYRHPASPVGLGDLKLAALIGLVTGFPAVIGAIFVGAVIGGLIMMLLLVLGLVNRRTYVPYGPFLLLGTAWVYFFALRGYLS
jgi:prepilin signal peptidase PulO-like enzyme (type II secretory pathway)